MNNIIHTSSARHTYVRGHARQIKPKRPPEFYQRCAELQIDANELVLARGMRELGDAFEIAVIADEMGPLLGLGSFGGEAI